VDGDLVRELVLALAHDDHGDIGHHREHGTDMDTHRLDDHDLVDTVQVEDLDHRAAHIAEQRRFDQRYAVGDRMDEIIVFAPLYDRAGFQ